MTAPTWTRSDPTPHFLALSKAIKIARTHHGVQERRCGELETAHLARVAERVAKRSEVGIQAIAIAWLHDILEKTNCPLKELQGFDNFISEGVNDITHKVGESYDSYIFRVSGSYTASVIKIADIQDNLLGAPSERKKIKYKAALVVLSLATGICPDCDDGETALDEGRLLGCGDCGWNGTPV